MAFQPTKRITRVVTAANDASAERRGWLSHGLAALGISALGLGVAASIALTTSAQTNDITDAPADLPVVAAPAEAGSAPVTKQSLRQSAALAAYARRDAAVERTSRSAALRGRHRQGTSRPTGRGTGEVGRRDHPGRSDRYK